MKTLCIFFTVLESLFLTWKFYLWYDEKHWFSFYYSVEILFTTNSENNEHFDIYPHWAMIIWNENLNSISSSQKSKRTLFTKTKDPQTKINWRIFVKSLLVLWIENLLFWTYYWKKRKNREANSSWIGGGKEVQITSRYISKWFSHPHRNSMQTPK